MYLIAGSDPDEEDYDSSDEQSYSFSNAGIQPDGLGNNCPDGGSMNSTLVPNPTTLQLAQMMEKMKALEELVARPQVQNLDTRQLGTQFA